ncbi:hypothetical protein BSN85_26035 [Bradyrhizobium brasilense]|uniref:MFS transporter n=1 Tax=Bradyrhizobium brasilense TaxID=1419277 RepID=UPI0009764AD0|nr:MFS transporter [Bradyrhizobium brasilense]OMI04881.1 hypothetical protein BSN85_26035 [Bradyrhizobium brasilense]
MQSTRQGDGTSLARVGFAVIVGSALEWYDFFLFGVAAATIFNKVFFPSGAPLLGTLAAFSTFSVGFIARPLGGILLAAWSDRYGRQSVLVLSLILMGLTSSLIGLVPSYEQAGIVAPVLLVILRIVQGIGAGVEYAIAAIYALEHHDERRRGLAGSFPGIGVYLGMALATLALQMTASVTGEHFLTWGWRLPFFASAVLLVFGVYIRRSLKESPEFEQAKARGKISERPLADLLRHQRRGVLTVFGAQLAQTGLGYLFSVFGLYYLTDVLELPRSMALQTNLIASIVGIFMVPVAGWCGSKIGSRRGYLIALALNIVISIGFFPMQATREPAWIYTAGILAVGVGVASLVAIQGAYFASCFSTAVRTSGFVLGRELSVALVGGFTPLIATLLYGWGGTPAVTMFAVVLGVASLLTVLLSRAGLHR